ncbi:hypothetical protein APHCR_1503 [Anaplasma phagocytophilum str. CR1007]|nr:hypothetical protein APHCR_1503 [Anaplasma phagocytophilum str. CR1007]
MPPLIEVMCVFISSSYHVIAACLNSINHIATSIKVSAHLSIL